MRGAASSMVFFSFDLAEKRSKYSRYLPAYPATSRPSIGNGLVRITWSGVAGPCCESLSTSGRRAKLRNFSLSLSQDHRKARLVGHRSPELRDVLPLERRSGVASHFQRSWGKPRMPCLLPAEVLLGHRDELDHQFIRATRVGAEREHAVREKHHAH